jgi:type IV secretory pathway TraG/TraD family ATPase VirD4
LFAPLDDVLQLVASFAAQCLLGAALGLALARMMRRCYLHWTWAAAVAAIALLAREVISGIAPVLIVGALCATARSRRWHREDLDAGLDLAAAAHARRTPQVLFAWLCSRWRARRGQSAPRSRQGALLLGHDESWRPVTVSLGGAGGGAHMLVVGATGSGKTVTQCRLAAGAIAAGMGAVVVDPKGDRLVREQLMAAAHAASRPFLEWTPEGPCIYNPFARGSATEVADKALAGERFTEPHYLRQAQRYLGHAVRVLQIGAEQVSLAALVECLDPEGLELRARRLDPENAEATFAYLDSLSARQRSDLSGVRDRLAVLVESEVGRWLDPRASDGPGFDLLECVRAQAVVLFCLQADTRPLLSQMLAAAIVQDLQTVVASSQEHPVPTLVVVDEFSAVAPERVVGLFARARSAGVSLVLGTQEISDLRPSGHPRLLEQVMGNLSVLIAHRQVVPASAELIANLAGTRGSWRVTRHSNGASSRTRRHEALLDPAEVMGFAPGWGAVISPGHGRAVRITRILGTPEPIEATAPHARRPRSPGEKRSRA